MSTACLSLAGSARATVRLRASVPDIRRADNTHNIILITSALAVINCKIEWERSVSHKVIGNH